MPLQQRLDGLNHNNNNNNNHHHPRRHEDDDDESSLPPPPSRASSSAALAPPPPPALGPEPSYETQLLLSDMFSQQATLRNYDPGSIQAVMMALDEERYVKEQQLYYEEASLALAQMMIQDGDDDDSSEHDRQRAHLSLRPPSPPPLPLPHPPPRPPPPPLASATAASGSSGGPLPVTMMRRDNSSSEDSSTSGENSYHYNPATLFQNSNNETDNNPLLQLQLQRAPSYGSIMPTMEELAGEHIGSIMPLPPPEAFEQPFEQPQPVFADSSSTSGTTAGGCGSSTTSSGQDEDEKVQIKNQARLMRKLGKTGTPYCYKSTDSASAGSLSPIPDSQKKMAAIPDTAKIPAAEVAPADAEVQTAAVAEAATATTTDGSSKKDKKKKKKKKKNRECLICQRTTAECKMRMRKLTCGHHFCSACIDRWLSTKDTCPYCRQQVKKTLPERQRSFGAVTA